MWMLVATLAVGCADDEEALPIYQCTASACDPVCRRLIANPPDPVRSQCSPPGPLCDYNFSGMTWEIACGTDGHLHCTGACPPHDLGVAPD
jgi:hypothetical protein